LADGTPIRLPLASPEIEIAAREAMVEHARRSASEIIGCYVVIPVSAFCQRVRSHIVSSAQKFPETSLSSPIALVVLLVSAIGAIIAAYRSIVGLRILQPKNRMKRLIAPTLVLAGALTVASRFELVASLIQDPRLALNTTGIRRAVSLTLDAPSSCGDMMDEFLAVVGTPSAVSWLAAEGLPLLGLRDLASKVFASLGISPGNKTAAEAGTKTAADSDVTKKPKKPPQVEQRRKKYIKGLDIHALRRILTELRVRFRHGDSPETLCALVEKTGKSVAELTVLNEANAERRKRELQNKQDAKMRANKGKAPKWRREKGNVRYRLGDDDVEKMRRCTSFVFPTSVDMDFSEVDVDKNPAFKRVIDMQKGVQVLSLCNPNFSEVSFSIPSEMK
jgi:hypothetical protein